MRRLALAVLLALAPPASAAEAPLSLAAAQAEARAHAPEAAELEARVEGARRAAGAASRVLRSNPAVSGSYAPGALTGSPEERSWEVGLSQTLDLSGSWRARGAAAAADRDRAGDEREDGLRALDEAVAVAVADVADAQRGRARTARIAALQEIGADAARRQLDVGEGNQLDVDAAQLALAAARADAARADGALAAARARLARLLGREDAGGIAVEDPPEDAQGAGALPSADALVDRAPAVRAADAEVRAARLALSAQRRTIWPEVTLGVFYGANRRDVPAGSFHGPASAGLSATWSDRELGFRLGFPLPVFDRKQPEVAAAEGRLSLAEARARRARADARVQLETARASLRSAQEALGALARTPEVVDRELALLEQAFRAGALDAVARAVALRTAQEAAARYDGATRDVRVARARWLRWAGEGR